MGEPSTHIKDILRVFLKGIVGEAATIFLRQVVSLGFSLKQNMQQLSS